MARCVRGRNTMLALLVLWFIAPLLCGAFLYMTPVFVATLPADSIEGIDAEWERLCSPEAAPFVRHIAASRTLPRRSVLMVPAFVAMAGCAAPVAAPYSPPALAADTTPGVIAVCISAAVPEHEADLVRSALADWAAMTSLAYSVARCDDSPLTGHVLVRHADTATGGPDMAEGAEGTQVVGETVMPLGANGATVTLYAELDDEPDPRVSEVIRHELGHAWGLYHRQDVPSVMAPSRHSANASVTITSADVTAYRAL